MTPTIVSENKGESGHNRLPEITWEFWVLTLLAVAGCETGADFLGSNIGLSLPGTATLIAGGLLAVLAVQFTRKHYVPLIYWLAIVLLNLFCTLITDIYVDVMGYETVTAVYGYATGLLVTLAVWYVVEKNLSIQNVLTKRREAFYWLAALFTFALGTAACDTLADDMAFGFLPTAAVYGAVIVVTAVAFFAGKLNGVFAFWIAYIFIRPMGAAFGNFLSHPVERGGLNYGAALATAIFFGGLVFMIVHEYRDRRSEPERLSPPTHSRR